MGQLNFGEFTRRYRTLKTLTMQAVPVGATRMNIARDHVIEDDAYLTEQGAVVKDVISRYHREFINAVLAEKHELDISGYAELYAIKEKTADDWERFNKEAARLRKEIAGFFSAQPAFALMKKDAEFVKKVLPEYTNVPYELTALNVFKSSSTNLKPYLNQKMYVYGSEKKANTIAYRSINDNLPKFIGNVKVYEELKERLASDLETAEKELCESFDEIFSMDRYGDFLSQKGIDRYNRCIGGYSTEERHIKGLNNYIAEYNHKVKDKKERLPLMTQLFKQILVNPEIVSFVTTPINEDKEAFEVLAGFHDKTAEPFDKLEVLIRNLGDYDPEGVFIKAGRINDISKAIIGDWSFITKRLKDLYDIESPVANKTTKKYKNDKERYFKSMKSVSLKRLDDAVREEGEDASVKRVTEYISGMKNGRGVSIPGAMRASWEPVGTVAEKVLSGIPLQKDLRNDDYTKGLVKEYADSYKEFERFVRMLEGSGDEVHRDTEFYNIIDACHDYLRAGDRLYNRIRNYVSQTPWRDERIRLTFGNPSLLNGWSQSVIHNKGAVLLLKDGEYFLGILKKGMNNYRAFMDVGAPEKGGEYFSFMRYESLDAAKQCPRLFITNISGTQAESTYGLTDEIKRIYADYKDKDKEITLDELHILIDYYRKALEIYKGKTFNLPPVESYNKLSDFYFDVSPQLRSVDYSRKMDADAIMRLVKKGSLYLFRLHMRDMNEGSHGKDSLSYMYWKALFDPDNADGIYWLNGGGSLFYRPATYLNPVVHKAGEPIKNKNPNAHSETSTYDYDIIKKRSFTKEMFMLSVPLSMNNDLPQEINMEQEINRAINKADGVNVLAVSRGETDLLYYAVVGPNGRILEHGSLNVIGKNNTNSEKVIPQDYSEALKKIEAKRQDERRSWNQLDNIANLKRGYLSQVVPIICRLMVKYNAVLCLEDIKAGFKNSRAKIERNVYQQFEERIIKKLNFYVDKNVGKHEPGGVFNAYQLTSPFRSFESIYRQTGAIFYVPPYYTSNIDPVTGFVNRFDTSYKTILAAQTFIETFDRIVYNEADDLFEFSFKYSNFTELPKGYRDEWTFCTYGDRLLRKINVLTGRYQYDTVSVTEMMHGLLREYNVSYRNGNDIREVLASVKTADFYRQFLDIVRLTLQMVNRSADMNYLISPVRGPDGRFFCTDDAPEGMPQNASANGAYNIARKGLILMKRIREATDEQLSSKVSSEKVNLDVGFDEWLSFASGGRQ